MNITQILQNILNFQSLSLLIGRMIIDGEFDTIKLVYHSTSLENRLIADIIAQLPTEVQFFITNIDDKIKETSPLNFPATSDWHIITDRTLQLIFVDKTHMQGHFEQFSQELNSEKDYDEVLYRLYVILVTNETNPSQYVESHGISKLNSEMSSILAICDTFSDQTEIFLFPNKVGDAGSEEQPIFTHQGVDDIEGNLFNLTLNYWYRDYRMISFYTKEYLYYERLNVAFEVYPQKNAHLIACINTVNNQLNGFFARMLVEEKLRMLSNDSEVTFMTRLMEVIPNKSPAIYDDVMPNIQEADLTD